MTDKREVENRIVELEAIIETVRTVLDGGMVSDFMESFSIVRAAGDIVSERDALKEFFTLGRSI
ncbi:hypothetical protein ES708_00711 [subsurface metagenome]